MITRRNLLNGGIGLASIIVAGKAPASIVKSLGSANGTSYISGRHLYDAEVEYLGTNPDGAYIDTQVPFPSSGRVRCKFFVDGTRAYGPRIRCWLFGGDTGLPFIYQRWYYGGRINFVDNAQSNGKVISTTWNNAILESDNQYSNGKGNVMFFGKCSTITGGAPRIPGAGANDRIYYLVIEDDLGNTVIDLIPVRFRNESGLKEGALYDRISGKLFRNSGTGSFIIGPDKE